MLFSYSFRRHQLHCSPSSLTISFLQYLFVLLLVKFLNYIKIIYVVNVRASLCFIWLILVLNPWCIFSGAVEFRWLFEAQSILGPIICWYYVQFSLEYSDAVARLFFSCYPVVSSIQDKNDFRTPHIQLCDSSFGAKWLLYSISKFILQTTALLLFLVIIFYATAFTVHTIWITNFFCTCPNMVIGK